MRHVELSGRDLPNTSLTYSLHLAFPQLTNFIFASEFQIPERDITEPSLSI